ncbi:MAG TPA: hypothetical protein ENN77_02545, partial [Candidatus Wirthbacteria bacterium]|nr:hypothetical protein [Candidatus Wirthbacteria bacterium]
MNRKQLVKLLKKHHLLLAVSLTMLFGAYLVWSNLAASARWSGDSGFHMGTLLSVWRENQIWFYGPPSGTINWRYPSIFSLFFLPWHFLSRGNPIFLIGLMGLLTLICIPILTIWTKKTFNNGYLGMLTGLFILICPLTLNLARSYSNPNLVIFAFPLYLLTASQLNQGRRFGVVSFALATGLLASLHVFTMYSLAISAAWIFYLFLQKKISFKKTCVFFIILLGMFSHFFLTDIQNNYYSFKGFSYEVSAKSTSETSWHKLVHTRYLEVWQLYLDLFQNKQLALLALFLSVVGIIELLNSLLQTNKNRQDKLFLLIVSTTALFQLYIFKDIIWPWYMTSLWVIIPFFTILGAYSIAILLFNKYRFLSILALALPICYPLYVLLPTTFKILRDPATGHPGDYVSTAQEVANIISADSQNQPFRFYNDQETRHQTAFEYFWALDQVEYSCDLGDMYILANPYLFISNQSLASCFLNPKLAKVLDYSIYKA